MPKTQTILSVFVASPDDVAEERDCIEDTVKELNNVWSKKLQISLELIKWESHTHPGISEDSQAVISEQIEDDYDIFVGLMWAKYGTPTKSSRSGTEEEFNNALKRWKENPNQIRILFYFKEAPVDPYKIDPDQLNLIKEFRKRIGKEGVLYRNFKNLDEFTQLVRIHLSKVVQEWGTKWGDIKEKGSKIKQSTPKSKIEEEQGLIDLVESGQENFETLTEVMKHITEEMQNLTEKLNLRTEDIKEIQSKGDLKLKQMKRSINLAAADMEKFSDSLEVQIQKYDESHTKGANAFIKSINLLKDFQPDNKEARKALVQIKGLESSLRKTRAELEKLYGIIEATPRVTTYYNRAKRYTLYVLEKFSDKMSKSILLTSDLVKVMEEITTNNSR